MILKFVRKKLAIPLFNFGKLHITTNVCRKRQLQLYIYSSNSSMSNHEGKWVLLMPYAFLILVNSTKKIANAYKTHTDIYNSKIHIV